MLLSLQHGFIYIHIPKTAGTSVTRLLQPVCVQPEKTQFRRLLSHLPVPENPERAWLPPHAKAAWIRHKVSPAIYDSAFKFATIRNPYDFAVSYFHYLRKNVGSRRHEDALRWDFPRFLRYLDRKSRIAPMDQASWITDRSGALIVDQVMHFETLEQDMRRVTRQIGLPETIRLPRLNVTDHRDYRSYYDEASRGIVERIFARDFSLFGYRF